MQPIELLKAMHKMLDFDEADSRRLVEMGKLLVPHAGALAEIFYAALDANPGSRAILDAEPDRRSRLHKTLGEWYEQIFSGKYNEAYAQRRWIIGLVHVRVGIPPMFVVGSMENVYRFSARKLGEAAGQLGGPLDAYVESLTKMLNTDLAFIEQSYAESTFRSMATEMGADARIFQRFMTRGAIELLEEARAGKF
ncbi:MAG TPA: protoglobin domain-containing protein [Anaerolineales bacterium]|nr:protoglobin domain-containing protein [Anaerolineales bacterium]